MAEKALHYDATCHHFRVTEMARGHVLLPKQQSTCPWAEPTWLGGSQRAPALTPASFDSTCPVSHQQLTKPSWLGGKPASDFQNKHFGSGKVKGTLPASKDVICMETLGRHSASR